MCCLAVCCAAGFCLWELLGGTDCVRLAGRGLYFRQVGVDLVMATDSAAAMEGRAGITFGVELVVPWDAPETVIDLHSYGVMSCDNCSYCGTMIDCLEPVPGYETLKSDLL